MNEWMKRVCVCIYERGGYYYDLTRFYRQTHTPNVHMAHMYISNKIISFIRAHSMALIENCRVWAHRRSHK